MKKKTKRKQKEKTKQVQLTQNVNTTEPQIKGAKKLRNFWAMCQHIKKQV